MSQDNVASFEREAFKKKLGALAAAGSVTDADFADVVYTAQSRFGLSEQQFRSAFGLSAGAVERWSMLKNLPQPSVRPAILEWVLSQL
jgi:hypothetical protein